MATKPETLKSSLIDIGLLIEYKRPYINFVKKLIKARGDEPTEVLTHLLTLPKEDVLKFILKALKIK